MSSTYLTSLKENLAKTYAKLLTALDPSSKEQRTYPVLPSPELVRDIASILIQTSDIGFPGKSKYLYPFTTRSGIIDYRDWQDLKYPSSSAREIYMLPYYSVLGPISCERIDARTKPFIVARLSTATMIGDISIRNSILREIRPLYRRSAPYAVSLRDVVSNMQPTTFSQLFGQDNISDHFISELTHLVLFSAHEGKDMIDSIKSLHLRYVRPTNDLTLKVKMYVSRADVRAYYVDRNPIRHLAAAILQAIVQPPHTERKREFDPINRFLPAKRKNIIEWDIPLEDDDIIIIGTGDITSFTNSNVNSWILVLTMVLVLRLECLQKFNCVTCVRIRNVFVEFKIVDVLLLYLFLVVGAVAIIDGQQYVAPGGYLGIKANIRLTSICFAILFNELDAKLLSMYKVNFLGQIGGDDFCTLFKGKCHTSLSLAWSHAETYITNHVGRLKAFEKRVIDQSEHEGELDVEFCKKQLYWKVVTLEGQRLFQVRSRLKLPIMSQLVQKDLTTTTKRKMHFLSFRYGVLDVVRHFDKDDKFLIAYDFAYRQFYNFHKDVKQVIHLHEITEEHHVIEDEIVFSAKANRLRLLNPLLILSDGTYYRFSAKDHAAMLDQTHDLQLTRNVYFRAKNRFVSVLSSKDELLIEKRPQSVRFFYEQTTETGTYINALFEEFRENISQLSHFY